MTPEASRSVRAGVRPGAYAVVRGEEPTVFLAEDASVLARLLASNLVAQLPADDVSSEARLEEMRRALLEERWADALLLWMDETKTIVDVYDESPRVWGKEELDGDKASLEIRIAPLFST
ncbi:MAG: hypothetical protein M3198_05720 [Actinomycetota bacterium]|nr:hypothetical protein [Actinomycetota bacterium]